MNQPEEWYEEFWTSLEVSEEEDGMSAIRLIGEMLAASVLRREGDALYPGVLDGYPSLQLDAEDQYLVRRIAQAAGVES